MANAWQLSAQCPMNCQSLLPQYVPIAFFASLHMCVVRQQLRGSHECSKLFVLHFLLACVVSFQIIKPWNVESILYHQKVFLTTKVYLHEKLEHENL